MESTIFKVCGVALISVVIIVFLRQMRADGGLSVRLISSVAIFGALLALSAPVIGYISELAGRFGAGEYTEILLKSLGVAFLSGICASICRDCGENTLGNYAEMAGKVEILVLTIPLIRKIIDTVMSLLENVP